MRHKTLKFASILIAGVGIAFWLRAQIHPEGFSFSSYEGGDGSWNSADIGEAEARLAELIPLGSPLSRYKQFFRDQGGKCGDVVDPVRFPNTVTCEYTNGIISRRIWLYIIVYDSKTMQSTDVNLIFRKEIIFSI